MKIALGVRKRIRKRKKISFFSRLSVPVVGALVLVSLEQRVGQPRCLSIPHIEDVEAQEIVFVENGLR